MVARLNRNTCRGLVLAGLFLPGITWAAEAARTVPPVATLPATQPDWLNAATLKQLDRRLPEIRFEAVALGDVVDFLRDVTGADIAVNWGALEAAGVKKTTPVSASMRDMKFSQALAGILANIGGGAVKLAYRVDQGVIDISTADDFKKNPVPQLTDGSTAARLPTRGPHWDKVFDDFRDSSLPKDIPLPATTPFDHDWAQREEYVLGYKMGFVEGVLGQWVHRKWGGEPLDTVAWRRGRRDSRPEVVRGAGAGRIQPQAWPSPHRHGRRSAAARRPADS